MNDKDAFLQAVLENPEDDAPRLAFADCLKKWDEPRAEFIQLQLEIAKCVQDSGVSNESPDLQDMRKRAHKLQRKHRRKWLGILLKLPKDGCWPHFSRGFVEGLGIRSTVLLNHAGDIFGAHPICRFTVILDAPEHFAAITRIKGLARLNLFKVECEQYANPDWPERHPIDASGAIALANAKHIKRLETLLLNHSKIGNEGLAALAGARHLRRITHLELEKNNLGDPAAAALADYNSWKKLRVINLSRNKFGARAMHALADWSALNKVRALNLSKMPLGDRAIKSVLHSPHAKNLIILDLSGTGLTNQALRTLADSPHLARLEVLGLSSNRVDYDGIAALASSTNLKKLHTISLEGNEAFDSFGFDWDGSVVEAGMGALAISQSQEMFKPRKVKILRHLHWDSLIREYC